MTKISVIVPIYNAEKYLRQCLDSIANQSFQDFEVICVDDGSTDSSPEILKEYRESDSRFRVIFQKNQFAGVARNNGIKIAYNKLRDEGFYRIGMEGKSKEYFYSEHSFQQYLIIAEKPLNQYLFDKWWTAQAALLAKDQSNRSENWICRKIESAVQCCREHGLRYTIVKIGKKLWGRSMRCK